MKYLLLETFTDFKCIGSACPFTCCAGWNIIIDEDSEEYYESVEGEFGERLRNNITRNEKNEHKFMLCENGRCPFLNDENLCDIYINLGEEHLCFTCTAYPRYTFTAGDIIFSGVSISCPEVTRFFLTHKEPLKIDFADDKKSVPNEAAINWKDFNMAIRAFTKCIDIAQNRSLLVRERFMVLAIFMSQLQSYVDQNKDPSGVIEVFSNPEVYCSLAKEAGSGNRNLVEKLEFCIEYLSFLGKLRDLDICSPILYELVKDYKDGGEFSTDAGKITHVCEMLDDSDNQIYQEQLMVYGLFRYFMNGYKKNNYLERFIFACGVSYLFNMAIIMLYYLKYDRMPDFEWLLMSIAHISRIEEHGQVAGNAFLEGLKEKGMFELEFLLRLGS